MGYEVGAPRKHFPKVWGGCPIISYDHLIIIDMKMEGMNCITPAIATPILDSKARKFSSNYHKTSIWHHTETAKRCNVMLGLLPSNKYYKCLVTGTWMQTDWARTLLSPRSWAINRQFVYQAKILALLLTVSIWAPQRLYRSCKCGGYITQHSCSD
jgi:hypothetical protein